MRSGSKRAARGQERAPRGGPCYPRAFNHALTSCLYQIGVPGTLPRDDTLKPYAYGAVARRDELPIPPGAAADPRRGRAVGQAHPPGARSRVDRPARRLAGLGRRPRWSRRSRRPGCPGPGRTRRTAADHAAAGRNVIISTGPASGKSLGYLLPALTEVLNGGTALYLSPTRALAADQLRHGVLARHARRARGRRRRRHPARGADLGPRARQLPAHHPGHAASFAAAAARPLGRLLPPPGLRDRGRVPHLPRRVRLARRPGAAPAAAGQRASHISHYAPARPGLHPLLGHDQRARDLRPAADRPRRGGGHRRTAPRAGR